MNVARMLRDLGAVPAMTPAGGLRLMGLSSLDRETAARVLDVARKHKAAILAELAGYVAASPALAEVDRFFSTAVEHRFPDGTTGWIDPAYFKSMRAVR